MDRLELHLSGGYTAMLVALGLISCGFVPLCMWAMAIKDYPKALDAEGVTLKSGRKLPWRELTEKRRSILRTSGGKKFVTGVMLRFGDTRVAIAPRALKEGRQVLPYLSRVLGEDFTRV